MFYHSFMKIYTMFRINYIMYGIYFIAQYWKICAKIKKYLHNLNISVTFAAQKANINFIILSKQ